MELEVSRPLVRRRAWGSCEGCGLVTVELDVHHRQARGAGGVHGDAAQVANGPGNLLALCRTCHDMTERAEEWHACIALGFRIPHAYPHDPRDVPALLWTPQGRAWWMLTDDAGYQWIDWPAEYRMSAQDLQERTWLDRLAVPCLVRR